MNPNRLLSLLMPLTGMFLFADAVSAQNRQATYNMSFEAGPAGLEFGGSVAASHWARRTALDNNGSAEFQVGASLIERCTVWGQSREAKAVIATYTLRHQRTQVPHGATSVTNTQTGSLVARVAGLTVFSSSASASQTQSQVIAPGQLFGSVGLARTIGVYGYGVSVRVRAQAGVTFGITPTFTTVPMAGGLYWVLAMRLTGNARGDVTGSASSYLSVPGVAAGVSSSLEFASARVDLDATATPTSQSGTLTYLVRAIRLQLAAFVTIYPPLLPSFTVTTPIVDWTAAQRTGSLPLL